jgi:hypothetical protein
MRQEEAFVNAIDGIFAWNEMSKIVHAILEWHDKYQPRRPYDEERPDGYLESNNDFMKNNSEIVLEFLDALQNLDEPTLRRLRRMYTDG